MIITSLLYFRVGVQRPLSRDSVSGLTLFGEQTEAVQDCIDLFLRRATVFFVCFVYQCDIADSKQSLHKHCSFATLQICKVAKGYNASSNKSVNVAETSCFYNRVGLEKGCQSSISKKFRGGSVF